VDIRRLVVLALLLIVAGCGSDVDPDLYGRVADVTDCNTLREQVTATDELVDWHIKRGDADQAQQENDYLEAIAKRMEEVGC
jgi:hypothetical protein